MFDKMTKSVKEFFGSSEKKKKDKEVVIFEGSVFDPEFLKTVCANLPTKKKNDEQKEAVRVYVAKTMAKFAGITGMVDDAKVDVNWIPDAPEKKKDKKTKAKTESVKVDAEEKSLKVKKEKKVQSDEKTVTDVVAKEEKVTSLADIGKLMPV